MLLQQNAPARQKRLLIQGVSLISVLTLTLTLWYVLQQYQQWKYSSLALSQMHNQADQVRNLERAFNGWQAYRQQTLEVQQQIKNGQLDQSDWQVRALTVEKAELPRWKVQAYLNSLQRLDGYLFLPERFELKALFDGDDLFRWQTESSDRLELTLVGEYFMRRQP